MRQVTLNATSITVLLVWVCLFPFIIHYGANHLIWLEENMPWFKGDWRITASICIITVEVAVFVTLGVLASAWVMGLL